MADAPNPLWEAEIPRFYRGSGNFGPKTPGPSTSVMVDGDPTTFWSQENFGPGGCKMQQEFYTIAPGGHRRAKAGSHWRRMSRR